MAIDQYLYDPVFLDKFKEKSVILKENLIIRPLKLGDYDRGYLTLLNQLTSVGDLPKEKFESRFLQMKSCGSYYITVIEDIKTNKVIGTITLFTEYKMIHSGSMRGRLEDLVVDSGYRNQKLSKVLIETQQMMAQYLQCYKVTIDCNDELIPMYKKFGFIDEPGRANVLAIRY